LSETRIRFAIEITEDQRQLNGTRYVGLEGASQEGHEPIPWTLSLNFAQSIDGSIEEGDLSITSKRGSIYAEIESGSCDSVPDETSGDERNELGLSTKIEGGDGEFAGLEGSARVSGSFRPDGGEVVISIVSGDL
jgi:hypothetical protein